MGLVPRNLHGGDRTDVKALDERRIEELLLKFLVLRDRGDNERGAKLLRQSLGDFASVFRHDHGGGVDTGAAAVVRDGSGDEIDVLGPALDAVLTDEDLAETGAVALELRIVLVLRDGVGVAEDER